MPAPDGWVHDVREPHPPAERWPSVGRNESAVYLMPSHSGRGQIAPTSRWCQRTMRFGMSPEVAEEAAKTKVGGIEAALEALAAVRTTEGPEVSLLMSSDGKAFSTRTTNRCAVESASVVERARKRLIAHEAVRQQLVQELEESEARLARLRDVSAQAPPTSLPDVGTQVKCLQQMVNQHQEERDA